LQVAPGSCGGKLRGDRISEGSKRRLAPPGARVFLARGAARWKDDVATSSLPARRMERLRHSLASVQ
jgi:hypothetical protein